MEMNLIGRGWYLLLILFCPLLQALAPSYALGSSRLSAGSSTAYKGPSVRKSAGFIHQQLFTSPSSHSFDLSQSKNSSPSFGTALRGMLHSSPSATPRSRLLPIEPSLVNGRLKNGLEFYFLPNSKPSGWFSAHFEVLTGSIYEMEDQVTEIFSFCVCIYCANPFHVNVMSREEWHT